MELTRDKQAIEKHLSRREDGFYTDTYTTIEFPAWYQDKGLYTNEAVHFIYGIFAIIIDNKYSVSLIPTVVGTQPVMIGEIDRGGEKYIQFFYAKGSKFLESTKTIMQPFLSYNFFDGYFMQAKVPWYIGYSDLATVMGNMADYGGSNLGENQTGNEMLVSFIGRTPKDKRVFYRNDPKGMPSFVDLMDVRYSSLTTVNKLAGNYFDESVVSALVHKETKPTTLENHVRR